jgi:hypothetical protein
VATSNQKQDHPHFGFSQTCTILHTTTTFVSQILFESHPPKSLAKFKNYLHAAISSSTWCALICQLSTLLYPADFGLNHQAYVIINSLLHPANKAKPQRHGSCTISSRT